METIFEPAVITMDRPATLELTLNNNDPEAHLMVVVQSDGGMRAVDLPPLRSGRARVHLGSPGLYLFMDAIGDHTGRGMLGMIVVGGPSGWGGWLAAIAPHMIGAPRGDALYVFALP